MSKLANLKKNRLQNMKKLQEKLEEQSSGGFQQDDRIWKPTFNKDKGKGTAIVRFLTPKEGDPFVEVKSYQFTGPGGHYWDLALQTIGEKDPIQLAAINAFRKAKADDDTKLREYAKKFMPRSLYYANVLVIKDEEKPENEGKVKIYQFGRQIYLKIEAAIQPKFDDMEPLDPFDYWEGADFRIRMEGRDIPDSRTGKKIKVPNYEDSSFDEPSKLFKTDEEIEDVYEQTFNLSDFVDPEKFKSFDEVAEKFKKVTGKPYNWLTQDGVEQHIEEQEDQKELDSEVDDGDDDYDSEPEQGDMDDTDDDGGSEGETALEKFRRLAKKK